MSEKSFISTDIEIMLEVKRKLEGLTIYEYNSDYHNIVQNVDRYLNIHCKHHFVSDLIDIDPDRSKKIRYCTVCYMTSSENTK